MLFSSLTFLLYFLPVTFLVCLLLNQAGRNVFLLAASLFFYGWADPIFLLLILFEILAGWLAGLALGRLENRKAFWLLMACVLLFAGIFGYFKYTDFIIASINHFFSTSIPLLKIVLPLGISFYTFQILSYVVDVYKKRVEVQHSLLLFALYVSMFPQLIAGPIVRYSTIAPQLEKRTMEPNLIWQGVARFACGLGKKVLIANQLYAIAQDYRACLNPSIAYAWLSALALTLYTYYDFSGYSDMAIGLGWMFGFHLPENFNYPFTAQSIQDFWRRWHMSLTAWFKDYVYIPLGGSRCSAPRHMFNLLVVWLFTGIWHGAGWNFIFWGLGFCLILIFEKYVLHNRPLPVWIRYIYVWLILLVSFELFHADDMSMFFGQIQALFGCSGLPAWNSLIGFVLKNNMWFLLAACLGATALPHRLYVRMETLSFGSLAAFAGVFGCLLLCIAWIIGGSFNPFLYFRF